MATIEQPLGRVAIVPKGAWAEGTAYTYLDLVSYGGGSYLAKQDTSAAPTDADAWLQVAAKGDPLTFDDLTAEQIAELQQPATEAATEVRAEAEEWAAAEAGRVKAESARVEAETARDTAEEARAAAETERAGEFATLKSASEAATASANSAAATANTAAQTATTAAETATTAAQTATSAASDATAAASSATTAAQTATASATAADTAAASANQAATDATTAAGTADEAATKATASATAADTATASANTAAEAATTAAATANTAAERAEAAAESIELQTEIYGVAFTGGVSAGERRYAAVGKTATISTNTVAGASDFDDCDPFRHERVKRKPDSTGVWHTVAVEGTPMWDLVDDAEYFHRSKNFYFVDTDELKAVSVGKFKDSEPLLLNDDGTMPEYLYIPCYQCSKNPTTGAAQSRPGYFPMWGSYSNFRTAMLITGDACHGVPSWFTTWLGLLPVIEFADKNAQNIAPGFAGGVLDNTSYYLQEDVTDSNTVKIDPAYAGNFIVGQGAYIGQNTWGAVGSEYIACDERTVTAVDAETGEITLDGDPFSATTEMKLSNLAYRTGSTDSILGHTGTPVAGSNKYPMKYRDIEDPWGGQGEGIIDLRLKLEQDEDGSNRYAVYYCPDPVAARDCTDNAPDENFADTGLKVKTYGYITSMGAADAYPELRVPAEVGGGSSTTYYCDWMWVNDSYPDDRNVRIGGSWRDGGQLGPFSRNCSVSATDRGRFLGSRLFVKP